MYRKLPYREKLQTLAAMLIAEDELSDHEIARQCGITRRTLMRWKKQPAVQKKIDEHLSLSKQKSEAEMILERHMRIAGIELMLQTLEDIRQARAISPEMRDVPGGRTGLLRRRKVFFADRPGPWNYELDLGMMREMRRLEVAAAKAMGQWKTPKYQPFAWPTITIVPSGKHYRAALLIADCTKSDLEIAAGCEIDRRTLARWKKQPGFRTRVAEMRTTIFR